MCDFCERFDFSSASTEVSKYSIRIKLAAGSYRYPRDMQFNYCPKCGKRRDEIDRERSLLNRGENNGQYWLD